MIKPLITLAALLSAAPVLAQASANIATGKTQPSPLAPSEIVAAAPKGDWVRIAPADLLVMDLAPDAKGKPRRVVIQLMPPPFSQGWIGNIRKLAAAHWWDGLSINRVQDNYVVQWGDANADDKAKAKPLQGDLAEIFESGYSVKVNWGLIHDPIVHGYEARPAIAAREGSVDRSPIIVSNLGGKPATTALPGRDSYADATGFFEGWPVGGERPGNVGRKPKLMSQPPGHLLSEAWPVHCYGMVGVGRDLSPNTGNGAELYVVIGHAPRHLDRNIALVGRVIEGIEHLSSLPRGHGALGFYDLAQGDERTGIAALHPGTEVKDLPAYEYLSTDSGSFAKYADARANRRDAFFIRPAGGADICNIPVPVRRVP